MLSSRLPATLPRFSCDFARAPLADGFGDGFALAALAALATALVASVAEPSVPAAWTGATTGLATFASPSPLTRERTEAAGCGSGFISLREAVRLEDELVYDEPPGWMQPVRHALGALLLDAGRADEAEQVYREDLARNPANGWSLLGLEQSLRAQSKGLDEADALAAARAEAWARSDANPTSSCYCAPGAP